MRPCLKKQKSKGGRKGGKESQPRKKIEKKMIQRLINNHLFDCISRGSYYPQISHGLRRACPMPGATELCSLPLPLFLHWETSPLTDDKGVNLYNNWSISPKLDSSQFQCHLETGALIAWFLTASLFFLQSCLWEHVAKLKTWSANTSNSNNKAKAKWLQNSKWPSHP